MNFDFKKSIILPGVILLFSLLLLNLIARNWYKRFDLTDTKMYSLSSSTKQVIKKIDDLSKKYPSHPMISFNQADTNISGENPKLWSFSEE